MTCRLKSTTECKLKEMSVDLANREAIGMKDIMILKMRKMTADQNPESELINCFRITKTIL